VNRVIVGPDKLRESIDMSVVIFICKIFVDSNVYRAIHTFYDRTFVVGGLHT